ncbi:MAG: right-handed parallel beta-helix repeat-containing protein, partial [Candidatus Thermoplasmatota archaeon]
GQFGIFVEDYGKFYIYNSTITSVGHYYYHFKVRKNGLLEMKKTKLFKCGYSATKEESGLYIRSDNVILEENEIRYNYYGMYIDSASPTIKMNNITYNSYGIYIDNASPKIEGNNITNNWQWGMNVSGIFAKPTIKENEIKYNYMFGIYSHSNAMPLIEKNKISKHITGIFLLYSDANIKNNTIQYNTAGISMVQSSPEINGNFIQDNVLYGIFMQDGSPVIEENKIQFNGKYPTGWGLQSLGSKSLILRKNLIDQNFYGISIYNSDGKIAENSIFASKGKKGYGINCANSLIEIKDNVIQNHPNAGIIINGNAPEIGNNDISGNLYGIYLVNTTIEIKDKVINGNQYDFSLQNETIFGNKEGPSFLNIVNVTFGNVEVKAWESILNVSWYLDLEIVWQSNESLVKDAVVEIYEKVGNKVYIERASGELEDVELREYFLTSKGKTETTPHKIIITSGKTYEYEVNVSGNKFERILLDDVPPALTITDPKDGLKTNLTKIDVIGKTEKFAIVNVNGISKIADEKGEFSFTVGLQTEGENLIEVSAIDESENEKTLTLKVFRDTIPPNLKIEKPEDGAYTNRHTVEIIGKTEKNAIVKVNGIVVEADGKFNTTVKLEKEGENIIIVEAWDEVGNYNISKVKVLLDTIPPKLMVSEPEDELVTGEERVKISGMVEEGAELKINNESVTTIYGTFTYSFKLKEGKNIITVEAKDKAGNLNFVVLTVTYDSTPPIISIEEPKDGQITNKKILYINGSLDEEGSISINGEKVTLSELKFTHQITLLEGSNEIVVQAIDKVGNERIMKIFVVLDSQPPSISVSLPAYTNKKNLTVEGEVIDCYELKVNGEVVLFEGKNFSTLVSLLEGENIITIEARDEAGNLKIERKKVILDTIPPKIEIMEPEINETKEKEIKVKGKTEVGAKVYVNDKEVNVSEAGEFAFLYHLSEGDNTITVKAVDSLGNEKIEKIEIKKLKEKKKEDNSGSSWDTIGIDAKGQGYIPVAIMLIVLCVLVVSALIIFYRRRAMASQQYYLPQYQPTVPQALLPFNHNHEADLRPQETTLQNQKNNCERKKPKIVSAWDGKK